MTLVYSVILFISRIYSSTLSGLYPPPSVEWGRNSQTSQPPFTLEAILFIYTLPHSKNRFEQLSKIHMVDKIERAEIRAGK